MANALRCCVKRMLNILIFSLNFMQLMTHYYWSNLPKFVPKKLCFYTFCVNYLHAFASKRSTNHIHSCYRFKSRFPNIYATFKWPKLIGNRFRLSLISIIRWEFIAQCFSSDLIGFYSIPVFHFCSGYSVNEFHLLVNLSNPFRWYNFWIS